MKFAIRLLFFSFITSAVLFSSACSRETPEQRQARRQLEVENVIKDAQRLIFEEKAKKATELLEGALVSYGESSKLCEAIAYAYSVDNNPALAASYYEKAADIDSSNPDLFLYAASAYEAAIAPSMAVNAYEKYLKLNPSSTLAWKAMAKCLEKQDMFEDALNAYLSALKNSGRNATTSEAVSIGTLFLKLKNVTQAKNWLESALTATATENKETRAQILEGLTEIYLEEKNMESLEKVFTELMTINPELANKRWPDLKQKIDDFKRSIKETQEAIEKAKQVKIAEEKRLEEEKLSVEKKAQEEKSEAAKQAQEESVAEAKELKEAPKPELTPEEKERAKYDGLMEEGDFSAAEQVAQKMVQKKPNSAAAWRCLAKSYSAKNQNRDAFFAAREAMRSSPDDPSEALLYLSAASKIMSVESLLDALYLAKERFPNTPEIMLGLARTYSNTGNTGEARYNYMQFFKLADKEHPLREEAQTELDALPEPKPLGD